MIRIIRRINPIADHLQRKSSRGNAEQWKNNDFWTSSQYKGMEFRKPPEEPTVTRPEGPTVNSHAREGVE
jgi:hypothetical protein